jgi:hypothetical protein
LTFSLASFHLGASMSLYHCFANAPSRFPIQEYGVNYASQPLQRHEIRFIRDDLTIIQRILQSYRLMLDFYGMRLSLVDTGLVERALPPTNYAARYNNLIRESFLVFLLMSLHPRSSLRIHAQQPPNHAYTQMSLRDWSRAAKCRLLAACPERAERGARAGLGPDPEQHGPVVG